MSEAKSYRGVRVDMAALMMKHEKDVALGNGRMNARGDIIGRGGKVVKKREDLIREYHENDPKAVTKVSIHDNPSADRKAEQEFKELSQPVIDEAMSETRTKKSKPIDEELKEKVEQDEDIKFTKE